MMAKSFKTIQPRFVFEAPAPEPFVVPAPPEPSVVADALRKATGAVSVTVQDGATAAKSETLSHLPELSKDFLFAGRALFTVSNDRTKTHYTYKVNRKEGEFRGKRTSTYFVKVKDASAQWGFAYLGILQKDGTLITTSKSRYGAATVEFKGAQWACAAVVNGKAIPEYAHIQHAGRCGKCGKELTDPTSIKFGIGPECRKAMGL